MDGGDTVTIPIVGGPLLRVGMLDWLRSRALELVSFFALRSEPTDRSAASDRYPPADEVAHQQGNIGAPDLAAFDAFYTRHEQTLYGYLRRMTTSHEVALELAQETFLRAWRRFDQLAAYDRPEAWLFRVATNLALSHLRRKRSLSLTALFGSARSDAAPRDEDEQSNSLAASLDLERQTVERDTIERALRALPERQRAALLLAARHGCSSDEIAAALGVSHGNARQILSRARSQFRRCYADETQRHDA